MVRDSMLFCAPLWLDPIDVCCFPAAEYINGRGMVPRPLSSHGIFYFEWQRRCTFYLGEMIKVCRRCPRIARDARFDRTSSKL